MKQNHPNGLYYFPGHSLSFLILALSALPGCQTPLPQPGSKRPPHRALLKDGPPWTDLERFRERLVPACPGVTFALTVWHTAGAGGSFRGRANTLEKGLY